MKYLFYLLFLPYSLVAQEIPKNANTAIIENTSLDKVVRTLIDSGFVIKKLDKEYQFVETEYTLLCHNCIPQIQFYARVKDSTAILTGKWRSNLGSMFGGSTAKDENATVFEVMNEKSKVPRMAFNKMKNIASAVGVAKYELRKR